MIELIVTMGPSENMVENTITRYKINRVRSEYKAENKTTKVSPK